MHSVNYTCMYTLLLLHYNKLLPVCASMLHIYVQCLTCFKWRHASLSTRTVTPDGRQRNNSRCSVSPRVRCPFNALGRYWIWQSTYLKVMGNSFLRLAGARQHLTKVFFTPRTRSEGLPSGLSRQLITINLTTHTNRMYSDLTNEATILPFILHHQNKLNKAQDCCCVSLALSCWKRPFQVSTSF